jgi:hypothetical protein
MKELKLFAQSELSTLETLDIMGGTTNAEASQTGCSNNVVGCNCTIIQVPAPQPKYKMVFFENKRSLQCKYLPLCMGVCPRDNYTKACKLENVDFHIEDSLVNYIDTMYEAKSDK